MAIDPIFWDLAGQSQLRSEPLSFRYFGALTCPGLILEEMEIDEDGGPDEIAQRMLKIAEATLQTISARWSLDSFFEKINSSIDPNRLFSTAICTLIADGRGDEALELSKASADRGEIGGLVTPQGTFPELAARYLKASH